MEEVVSRQLTNDDLEELIELAFVALGSLSDNSNTLSSLQYVVCLAYYGARGW